MKAVFTTPILGISTQLLSRIQRHAEQAYPYECCGLLVGQTTPSEMLLVHAIYPTRNATIEAEQHNRYLITPDDHYRVWQQSRRDQLSILGCYHSHPNDEAIPTNLDLVQAWLGYIYLIVATEGNRATACRAWCLRNDINDLEREFEEIVIMPTDDKHDAIRHP